MMECKTCGQAILYGPRLDDCSAPRRTWTGLIGVITLFLGFVVLIPWVVLAGYYVAVAFGRYATWVIVR